MAKEEKNVVEQIEEIEVKKCLFIEREVYESKKSDEERYLYFVRGTLRGREVKASIIPTDLGGYDLLDIVFIGSESVELVLIPYEMTDEKTGRVTSGFTYEARNVDENGKLVICKVRPRQASDKSILEMLLARL